MRAVVAGIVACSLLAGCDTKTETVNDVLATTTVEATTSAAAGKGAIFCPEINRRTSRGNCDDLTATATQAKKGTAAFNVPDMVRDQASPIMLAVSLDPPATDMTVTEMTTVDNNVMVENMAAPSPTPAPAQSVSPVSAKQPHPRPMPYPSHANTEADRPVDVVKTAPGHTEQFSPVVGRDMRAELIGEGFKIDPRTPASQVLNPGSTTTWQWAVTPVHGSNYSLTIRTSVEGVMADGQRVVLGSTTRTYPVKVKIRWYSTLWDALSDTPAWIKLLTGVLIALGALAAAWWGFVRAARGGGSGNAPPPPANGP